MSNLAKALAAQGRRVLLTGLPGSGKSTLAAKLSERFKLHWIDTERGVMTLQKLPEAWKQNINYVGIPDSATMPMAAETLTVLFKNRSIHICDKHGKHNCPLCAKETSASFTDLDLTKLSVTEDILVIDTITQLSASLLAHQMRNKPIDAKPERDDWGSLRKFTEFFSSQLQSYEGNLIVIAHITEATLDNGKAMLVPNFGSAAASAAFGKIFDDVVYCAINNKKHVAYSSSTALPNVLTKSRTDVEVEKLAEPSLLGLFVK